MKQAIQRFIRDDKGNAKVVLIDAQTLQPVLNPAEYEILNQTQSPYWEPVQDVAQPDVPSKVQPPAQLLNQYIQQSGGDPNAPAVKSAVQTHTATQASVGVQPASVGATPASVGAPQATAADTQQAETSAPAAHPTSVGTPVESVRNAPLADVPAAAPSVPGGLGVPPQDRAPPSVKADMTVQAPENRGFAALTEKYGAHRPNPPSTEVSDKVREAAAKAYGAGTTVTATSGTEGDLPQFGSNRHKTGKAMDFQVTRPDGTVVTAADPDAKNFAETAKTLGIEGVGFGADYMGGNHFHMDTVKAGVGQDNEWGNAGNSWKTDLDSAGYLGNTKAERQNPGIPSARPAEISGQSVAKGIVNQAKDVTGTNIQGDPSKVSPAQMAGLGLMTHPRTPDQISRMAAMFAGELGPDTLEGLVNGDETARKELAGMVSTAENRAAKAKSFDAVFDPGQYNSLMDAKKSVTAGNYAKYGTTLRDAIGSFYTPNGIKPESYDPTSYYNPDISTPAWGSQNKGKYGLMGATDVGNHRFGSVADRSYKTTDLSDRTTGPTEGGAGRFGIGGLGSGLNSPSEGGARFGGTGLGKSYSGNSGSVDSPSEGANHFGGSGLGSKSSPSHDKDKDKDKSQGPSGGGYGGWGGPH